MIEIIKFAIAHSENLGVDLSATFSGVMDLENHSIGTYLASL